MYHIFLNPFICWGMIKLFSLPGFYLIEQQWTVSQQLLILAILSLTYSVTIIKYPQNLHSIGAFSQTILALSFLLRILLRFYILLVSDLSSLFIFLPSLSAEGVWLLWRKSHGEQQTLLPLQDERSLPRPDSSWKLFLLKKILHCVCSD